MYQPVSSANYPPGAIQQPSKGPSKTVLALGAGGLALAAVAVALAYRLFFVHPEPAPNPPKSGAPVVALFRGDPGSQGKPSTLRWDVRDADHVFISPEVGSVQPSGSADVQPPATTTYKLTASGPGGKTSASAVIEITGEAHAPVVATPKILVFEASPPTVKKGAQLQLKWRVEGEVSGLSIEPGIGNVTGDSYAIVATRTTTYILSAHGKTGVVSKELKVTVDEGSVPKEPRIEPRPQGPDRIKLYESAVALRNSGQTAQALPLFRQAAELGEMRAALEMGRMLYQGHDTPQDNAQALKWFRKAADAGSAQGMLYVGLMTAKGAGTDRDERQGAMWCRKAADAGYSAAMDAVGVLYANGQGVSQDLDEAARWYKKGADNGYVAAMVHLAAAYENGKGVSRNLKDAIYWYQMAADRGDRDAAARIQQLTAIRAGSVTGPERDPQVSGQQFALTGIQPQIIMANQSQLYTIKGSGLTAKTVVSLANIKAFVGSRSGGSDYYPAAVAPDGTWVKIYIGPVQQTSGTVRVMAQKAGAASVYLSVAVR